MASSDPLDPLEECPPRSPEARLRASRLRRVEDLLRLDPVDLDELRRAAWHGLSRESRAQSWRLLLNVCPPRRDDQAMVRKREHYLRSAGRHYVDLSSNRPNPSWVEAASLDELNLIHQVQIDVPRTLPTHQLMVHIAVQRAMERILVVWALRHPASGYVQGINDLITPFFLVYARERGLGRQGPELDSQALLEVEADVYWSISQFIQSIQDNYTMAQPGIQRMLETLERVVATVDPDLRQHFRDHGVQFVHFSFRWMNCLLIRELPLDLIVRLWDTYIAEGPDFATLHAYVCASLLVSFSRALMEREFQSILLFLHDLPTRDWSEWELEVHIAQAYLWRQNLRQDDGSVQARGPKLV